MTRPAEDDTKIASQAEFRRLIVQLGIAMVAAGDAVDIIEESRDGGNSALFITGSRRSGGRYGPPVTPC
jgi:hypothetical protein